ncbi:MAG: lysophospholipid acyltransferase family protein [Ferruginibacter sp.]
MRYLLKPVQYIYTIYCSLVFVTILLFIMPLVIIASFFGKIRGGNIITVLIRCWVFGLFLLCGIRHRNIWETAHDSSRQYIFVTNHISFLDIPIIFKAIPHQKIRILGKYELSKVPVFGFLYRHVVVMVDRSSQESRAKSVRQLKSVIKKGLSVYIFPEGTFNETGQPLKDFYDGAFRIAIETQTPIKPILFLDAYDRLNYRSLFSLNPGKCRAVYLEEIPVEGLTIKNTAALKEKVFTVMEEALVRYNASWINEHP